MTRIVECPECGTETDTFASVSENSLYDTYLCENGHTFPKHRSPTVETTDE